MSTHREILAAFSTYFQAMFRGSFREASADIIKMKDVSYGGLKTVIGKTLALYQKIWAPYGCAQSIRKSAREWGACIPVMHDSDPFVIPIPIPG